jgi:two-component sensor histidine kinase
MLAPLTAQPLSMALHELATNAAKYGSLSVPDGRLDISWREDLPGARLRLRWRETGGPPIAAPPERRGFGSRVIETTVRDQLRGDVSFTWEPTGLVCDIDIPLHRVAAPPEG